MTSWTVSRPASRHNWASAVPDESIKPAQSQNRLGNQIPRLRIMVFQGDESVDTLYWWNLDNVSRQVPFRDLLREREAVEGVDVG